MNTPKNKPTKKNVKHWYLKWLPLWISITLAPIIASTIYCIKVDNWNEMKYGAIATGVFTLLTISGFIFNLATSKK